MTHFNEKEHQQLTQAAIEVTDAMKTLERARWNFSSVLTDTVRRVGTIEFDGDPQFGPVLETMDNPLAVFKKMEWNPQTEGVTVTALSVSDLKTLIEVPLSDITDPEALYGIV